MTAHTFHSGSASVSVGGEVLAGAGVIGDSIGTTITQVLTTTGTIPGATRFSTETITIDKEASAALLPSCVAEDFAAAVMCITARAGPPGRSKEIPGLLVDTLNPAVRAASAPVPSATTAMADRKGAFRNAAAPASVQVEGLVAAEAAAGAEGLMGAVEVEGIGNRQLPYVSGRS